MGSQSQRSRGRGGSYSRGEWRRGGRLWFAGRGLLRVGQGRSVVVGAVAKIDEKEWVTVVVVVVVMEDLAGWGNALVVGQESGMVSMSDQD